ncbi:MAG: BrnA antitoxin family protein [Acidobacteria bacterium]|nr:BrnA antitoxin family protein [Acidobacteriota bacterium]
MKTRSKTDWKRIDAMSDDDIDTSDIPELDDAWFADAELRIPEHTKTVLINIDEDVLKWFEEQGPGYQFKMNAALKIYADAHR